jgi:hypothetical protein
MISAKSKMSFLFLDIYITPPEVTFVWLYSCNIKSSVMLLMAR